MTIGYSFTAKVIFPISMDFLLFYYYKQNILYYKELKLIIYIKMVKSKAKSLKVTKQTVSTLHNGSNNNFIL